MTAKFSQLLAAVAFTAIAVVFAVRYWQLNKPPISPTPSIPSVIGPMQPRSEASSLADRLTQQVARFHADHGKFPAAADFWSDMSAYVEKPLHNPINGSAEVVSMRRDFDAKNVGWVYDEVTGAVYPGAVFNAGAFPTTRP